MQIAARLITAAATALLMVSGVALTRPFTPFAVAEAVDVKTIVNQAKARQEVGEQIDGYLGLISGNVSADVRAAVEEINIRRKSVYTELARTQGVSVGVVARLSGQKLVARARPGEKIKLADGSWHPVG